MCISSRVDCSSRSRDHRASAVCPFVVIDGEQFPRCGQKPQRSNDCVVDDVMKMEEPDLLVHGQSGKPAAIIDSHHLVIQVEDAPTKTEPPDQCHI